MKKLNFLPSDPEEARRWLCPDWIFEGRRRVGTTVLALDPPRTKLVENAFDVIEDDRKFTAEITVSDPASIVTPGSPFDREFLRSVLQGRQEFDGRFCFSLAGSKPRPTVTISIDLEKETLDVIDYHLESTYVVGVTRLSFEDTISINRKPRHPKYNQLSRAFNLNRQIRNKIKKRGRVTSEDAPVVVETFMGLANTYLDKYCLIVVIQY